MPVFDCFLLSIDVELRTPIRTQTEKDKYGRIFDLALSYGRAKKEPFADWFVGSTTNYLIEPKKFIEWAKLMGEKPPEEWQPTVGAVEKGGPCWEEAGRAIKEMRGNPNIGTPKNQEQLYRYMLESENKDRFQNCCMESTELFEWTSVKARVWRERSEAGESITDPLKEPRFLT